MVDACIAGIDRNRNSIDYCLLAVDKSSGSESCKEFENRIKAEILKFQFLNS